MLAELHKTSPEETKEQRVTLGLWLRSLREEQGLSQRELADILSLDYYTFISQKCYEVLPRDRECAICLRKRMQFQTLHK